MAAILDIVGSIIFSGILLLTGIRLNTYIGSCQYQSLFDLRAQQQCTQLGSIVENDLYKIGYGDTTGMPSIQIADTSTLQFTADIDDNGTLDSVRYYLGRSRASFKGSNPRHRILYRRFNNRPAVPMDFGVTRFRLQYYDENGVEDNDTLSEITAIRVRFDLESCYRSVTAGGSATPGDIRNSKMGGKDTVYNSVHWEQFIVPKTLHW